MDIMSIKTVIFALLIIGGHQLDATEDVANSTNSIQLIDKKIDVSLNKAERDHQEEPGFISKISNLIFGSEKNEDSIASDTHHIAQYGPPPHGPHGRPVIQSDCNPCNKEPWIPIIRDYGHHSNVDFGHHPSVPHHPGGHGYGNSAPDNGLHLPGPTPHETYGPPPINNFQPPPPIEDNFGAHDFSGPPVPANIFGPPKPPTDSYGPPQLTPQLPNLQPADFGPPLGTYGPPKPLNEYHPPISQHGPPHGPPPNFGNHYGPPKPIYKIPSKNYGPPQLNQPTFDHSKPIHSPGKAPRQIRPGFNRPHHQFGPPPPQPVYKYIPLHHKGKFQHLPTNFEPPPPPSPHYNPGGPIYNNFHKPQQFPQPPRPTNPEYLPPTEQLPISSGHNAPEPIALPNLSLTPVAPLHNPQNFHDNFPQPGTRVEIPFESNVQIQQSIPVADFLASIEHPINIIRSPIVEVNVANASTQSDGYHQPPQRYEPPREVAHVPPSVQPTYRPTGSYGGYDDYKLSDNPIVVEDTHAAAATNSNKTVTNYNNLQNNGFDPGFLNQILNGINGVNELQTPPPSTSMQPPPIGESPWLASLNLLRQGDNTTKKPKQIQIIIPYTTNNKDQKQHQNQNEGLNSLHQPPSRPEGHPGKVRNHQIRGSESQEVTVTNKPSNVINIEDFFKGNPNYRTTMSFSNLPFDVIRLQKNIDGWTEQEYSKSSNFVTQNTKPSTSSVSASTATTKFVPSKRIPDEYLTTLPYHPETKPSTSPKPLQQYQDHEPAGSNSKEYLDSNLIATTEPSTTPKYNKLQQSWDKIHIAVSPFTKEKIYVVTPQPKNHAASSTSSGTLPASGWRQSRENERNTSSAFSISIMPMATRNKTKSDTNDVRVVLSEWPHLINNLATTMHTQPSSSSSSSATSTPKPTRSTSPHPLFGLMDLSSYTPPANSTIETYSGHSKVINVATASLRKRSSEEGVDEKKATSTAAPQPPSPPPAPGPTLKK